MTAGSSTNGESIVVSMPVAPRDTTSFSEFCGSGSIHDVSVSAYPVEVINYAGAFRFMRSDAPRTAFVGVDPGFALAAGDTICFHYTYEAAL